MFNYEENCPLPIRTILCPVDFSPQAEHAFQAACMLARDYAARVLVLHVAPVPITVVNGMMAVPPLPEDYRTDELEDQLLTLQAPYATVQLDHRLVQGEPAEEILAAAREFACDLIVMGTHGRTGLGRLVLGSVAEQVVRKADCPVLTMKSSVPAAENAARNQAEALAV